jgi:hypothetical protein
MKLRRFLLAVVILAGIVVVSHSVAFAQGAQFFAVLLGGNEVSDAGAANQGDPNGFGTATVIIHDTETICFAILVSRIGAPTAAHIHENVAGQNGSIVVSFAPNIPSRGNPGAASGCVTNVDPALVRRIRFSPSRFYVNVHNGTFPSGALRGQLF